MQRSFYHLLFYINSSNLYKTTFQGLIHGYNKKELVYNKENQLWTGSIEEHAKQFIPVNDIMYKKIIVSTSHILFLDVNNNIYSCGENIYRELGIGNVNKIFTHTMINGIKAKKLATKFYHSVLIDMVPITSDVSFSEALFSKSLVKHLRSQKKYESRL